MSQNIVYNQIKFYNNNITSRCFISDISSSRLSVPQPHQQLSPENPPPPQRGSAETLTGTGSAPLGCDQLLRPVRGWSSVRPRVRVSSVCGPDCLRRRGRGGRGVTLPRQPDITGSLVTTESYQNKRTETLFVNKWRILQKTHFFFRLLFLVFVS